MRGRKTPQDIVDRMTNLYQDGFSYAEIADMLGTTLDTVKQTVVRCRKKGENLPYRDTLCPIVVSSPKYNKFLKIKSDRAMITADSHGLTFDPLFASKMLSISRKYRLKDCFMIGDLFDMRSFSPWKETPVKWEGELNGMIRFVKFLLQEYDNVYFSIGNHDGWILKFMEGKIAFNTMMKLVTENPRFILSEYPYMEVNKSWLLVHPKAYSRTSGLVARRLAEKYHKNIITAHGHFSSMVFDISGDYQCFDVGGLVDYEKTEYIQKNITTHPTWNKGFIMLLHNCPYLFTEKSDWKFWLK